MKFTFKHLQFDKYFLILTLIIVLVGLLCFVSASLGILASNTSKFYNVIFNQLILGFVGGMIVLFLCMQIPYHFWRNYSFYFFLAALGITLLVFVPHIGFAHGGARRWISLGPVSFQPVELLKIAFVMYFAAWLVVAQKKKGEFVYKIIPLIGMLVLVAAVLLHQPDTKSLILIAVAGCAMLFVSGVPMKNIFIVLGIAVVALAVVIAVRPYVRARIKTFINPASDPRGSSYQLQQSLIAIGSGNVAGRGLGQSVQKFNYLPEPQGDSVFAVIGEEFGFIGTTILITLYVFFALRGYKIALGAADRYGTYVVTGLVTLLIAQSFLNIASLVGLFPLTGVPLVFISQGGTALMMSLATVGIILNVSGAKKKDILKS